jgi:hypothetical protein
MVEHAVETVRPQGAIRTRRAHIVHYEQGILVAEERGELDGAAGAAKLVVPHLLRLDRRLGFAELLAQAGDLAAVLVDFFGRRVVAHRFTSIFLLRRHRS